MREEDVGKIWNNRKPVVWIREQEGWRVGEKHMFYTPWHACKWLEKEGFVCENEASPVDARWVKEKQYATIDFCTQIF